MDFKLQIVLNFCLLEKYQEIYLVFFQGPYRQSRRYDTKDLPYESSEFSNFRAAAQILKNFRALRTKTLGSLPYKSPKFPGASRPKH